MWRKVILICCMMAVVSPLTAQEAEEMKYISNLLAEAPEDLPEDEIERLTDRLTLRCAVDKLSERDRMILRLRYGRGLSQQQTAAALGLTQVKVSREEKRILEFFREEMSV